MILFSPLWLILLIPLGFLLYRWPLPTRGLNIFRTLALLLLVLAMAQPAVRMPDRHGYVVVVADRSASMPAGSQDEQLEIIRHLHEAMGRNDRLSVVSFGAQATHELAPGLEKLEEFQGAANQAHSRMSTGLEAALSQIPPGDAGRILMLSDGHWTGSDPATIGARSAGRSLPIDYRWQSRSRTDDLAIRDLQAPASVTPGQAFMLSGWVKSPTTQTIDYELTKHGQVIASGQRQVPRGLSRLLFRDRAKIAGTAEYQLHIRKPNTADANGTAAQPVGDAFPENNRARTLVGVRGEKPVLLVSNFGAESGLVKLLVEGGVTLVARKPNQCPWTLEDLSRWSAVVLENVMAGDIGLDGMKTLRAWVEDTGAGLVMTGGEKSFAPGGYFGSPIEEILPVSMERRNEIRKLQTAIVVVLDRSGSMGMPVSGGKTKMDLANIGTAQVLDLLGPGDEFGVIAVDTVAHTQLTLNTAELQQNPANRNRVLSIQPGGGGIYVYTALVAARNMLAKSNNANRHIILFSDAQDSEQPGQYQTLIANMRKAGITISVIGLGTPSDIDAPLLKDIAKRGEGNVYFTDRPTEIPRIFAQDTFAVARNTFIKEPTALQMTGTLNTLGADPAWEPPAVGGYNLTYKREGASVGVLSEDEYRAPIVAYWQAGNGRVACFTPEADGTYAGQFARWTQAGDFHATLTRWAAGAQSPLPDNMLITQEVREGVCFVQLHLDPARAGESFTAVPTVTQLRSRPGREPVRTTTPMQWRTADMLEAELPLKGRETLLNTVKLNTTISQSLPPVCLPYAPEFAPDLPNRGRNVLTDLARSSGGQERLEVSAMWQTLPRQPRYVHFSLWLVLAGLVLFLLEVLQRRTGLLSFARRKSGAAEIGAASTTLRRRESVTQAPTEQETAEEQEKIFQPPKRKRRHRQRERETAEGPPVVAPPIMEQSDTPPVLDEAPPQLDATGNTYDAMAEARKRARDRGGR